MQRSRAQLLVPKPLRGTTSRFCRSATITIFAVPAIIQLQESRRVRLVRHRLLLVPRTVCSQHRNLLLNHRRDQHRGRLRSPLGNLRVSRPLSKQDGPLVSLRASLRWLLPLSVDREHIISEERARPYLLVCYSHFAKYFIHFSCVQVHL
jgi:hypothetical protein